MMTVAGAAQAHRSPAKSIITYLPAVLRVLIGILFVVMGLNLIFNFLPQPPGQLSPGAVAFGNGLAASGYMLVLLGGTQAIAGALLLVNRFVPLALTVLAPIVVNIVFYHAFLQRSGLIVAIPVAAIEIYLAWAYRDSFRSVLTARARPTVG